MIATDIRSRIFDALGGRFYYGWAIVAVAGLGIFATGPGQSHNFSVFVGPISKDLGISSTSIATAYGLATLGAAFLLPYAGALIDRWGPRRMMVLVVALLGVACLFFGAVANYLWLVVGFGLLRFFGQGTMMLTCANIVSQWFVRRRGFALSLMALGFGISMAVHPPLGQLLIETIGWRWAWVVLGFMTWVLMVPPILLILINRPEDKGLLPDGRQASVEEKDGGTANISGLTLAEALRTRTFYIVTFGLFTLSMLITALHFYQVSILDSLGLSDDIAARIFPISAVVMVFSMPLIGRLFDRFPTRYVLMAAFFVMSSSLVSITFADNLANAIVYAMFFGVNNAFTMTMFGYLWPRFFGRRHVGSIQGTGQMVTVFGASLGPLPVGLAFDLLGTPVGTLRLLALLPLLCAFAVLFLRTPAGVAGVEHLD